MGMTLSDRLKEALVIPLPENPALVLDGCRRLLGPNLYGASPGAVGDALFPADGTSDFLTQWSSHLKDLLFAVGWGDAHRVERRFDGGASLYLAAPVDRLFSAAYLIEAAWYYTACEHLSLAAIPVGDMVKDLVGILEAEANPGLCALVKAAEERGIDYMLTDDAVMLGHGAGSAVWPSDALPTAPDWAKLHDVPLALVTGTNGKTTTTRLIAAMGQASGRVSGLSSTDFVKVGEDLLEKGDYSGPAGARLLLGDRRLELGVLEVARGGILRRGLPVTHARAAVVTNVAADHLGQYGINTVAELAQVKMAVHRALGPGGTLILNADDAMVVGAAPPAANIAWFSLTAENPKITSARASGQASGWLEGGWIYLADGTSKVALIAVHDVPLTLGGAARYNIENAIAASLAARSLGIPDDAIRAVLSTFRSDARDNPGRANEFSCHGARVFVDFAHNPHSIAAITSALAALPANRRFVLLSHAGDRSDADIRGLVEGAFALAPDYVVAAENPKYLRGRAPGAVSAIIGQASHALGLDRAHVLYADSPADGARKILAMLSPGDLALLLVHDDRDQIFDLLRQET